jgi:hypothetical protein
MGGQIVPRRAIFAKGPYYVEVGAEPEGDHTAVLQAWTAALEKIAPGSNEVPVALSWFPSAGQQSLRLVPESVLGIRILKRGYVAQYDFARRSLRGFADSAAAVMQASERRRVFQRPSPTMHSGDRQVPGPVCVLRKGRYLADMYLADGQTR